MIKSINFKSGLQDENVSSIYEDNAGNIWLSLLKGISYIELNTPITNWTKYDGIKGTIESTCKFNNTIFIGTDKGLQVYNKQQNKFELTPVLSAVWDLAISNQNLLIATDNGVHLFNGKNFQFTDVFIK